MGRCPDAARRFLRWVPGRQEGVAHHAEISGTVRQLPCRCASWASSPLRGAKLSVGNAYPGRPLEQSPTAPTMLQVRASPDFDALTQTAAMDDLRKRCLWAWTAAAGRTFCVLKGRQNALFGWWRVGKVNQDRFSAIRGHHPMQNHRLFWVAVVRFGAFPILRAEKAS